MSELDEIRCELPDIERALVLAPHPDDESLGCGGTLARYSGKILFTAVAMSSGEAVNIPEHDKGARRREEFEAAMGTLGIRDLVFLDLPDGQFHSHKERLKESLSALYESKKPQMVFCPSPVDLHADHRETALACIRLMTIFPDVRVAFYEVYNPIRFNTLIDIGAVIEAKKEALSKYHYSMLKNEDIFVLSNLSLNRFRSFFALRESYYEAFWIPETTVDLSDISRWFTCGIDPISPEDDLLSRLICADTFLEHVRELERNVAEKTRTIERLSSEVANRDNTINALGDAKHLMEASFFWKAAKRFYAVRDRLFPAGSVRRTAYEKIVGSVKGKDL